MTTEALSEPTAPTSQVVIEQMASLVEQVRAIAFPEMVGQPIEQDELRAALAAIEREARATEAPVAVEGLDVARHAIVQASIALANEEYVTAHDEIERAYRALRPSPA